MNVTSTVTVLQISRLRAHWRAAGVSAVLALFLVPASVQVQCAYSVVEIAPPSCPFSQESITPTSMHDDGTIVGYYTLCGGVYRGFRRHPDGTFETLPVPAGAFGAVADKIAPDGTIVGTADVAVPGEVVGRLTVWAGSGVVMADAPSSLVWMSGGAAGNLGLAGGMLNTGFVGDVPALWQNGRYLPLPPLIASAEGRFNRINRFGARLADISQGIGFNGVLAIWFTDDSIEVLSPPRGYSGCVARSLNAAGHVAGRAFPADYPASLPRAHLWRSMEIIDLGVLLGMQFSLSDDINDVDQVVGGSGSTSGGGISVFFWADGHLYDLMLLAPPLPGGYYLEAGAINNRGQIAVVGYRIPNKSRIFLLTPLSLADADVTIDCKVDTKDLLAVLECWGPRETSVIERADIDGDGVIGPRDLAEVLGNWTP